MCWFTAKAWSYRWASGVRPAGPASFPETECRPAALSRSGSRAPSGNRPAVALSRVSAAQEALSESAPTPCHSAVPDRPTAVPDRPTAVPGQPTDVPCQPESRPVPGTCLGHKGAGLSTETPWCPYWPPELGLLPFNDTRRLPSNGRNANCSGLGGEDHHLVFTADHTRHYAAVKSHSLRGPHGNQRRPGVCLTVAVQPFGAAGSPLSCAGCANARA